MNVERLPLREPGERGSRLTGVCLVIMRQRRSNKRKNVPIEMPSFAFVEVISIVRKGGRLVKKRTIEPEPFDPLLHLLGRR